MNKPNLRNLNPIVFHRWLTTGNVTQTQIFILVIIALVTVSLLDVIAPNSVAVALMGALVGFGGVLYPGIMFGLGFPSWNITEAALAIGIVIASAASYFTMSYFGLLGCLVGSYFTFVGAKRILGILVH